MKITKEKFKKLKSFNTGTFALWNLDDISDTEIISNNLPKLHANLIIIGLNPSAGIVFLGNFHRKRYDHWYADVFKMKPFAGAYMTDLISEPQANAQIIVKKREKSSTFRVNNLKELQKQFNILGVSHPTIVCLGKNTYELLCSENVLKGKIWYLKHPNSYRTTNAKSKFIKEVTVLSRKIQSYYK